jgi:hypothetical protein
MNKQKLMDVGGILILLSIGVIGIYESFKTGNIGEGIIAGFLLGLIPLGLFVMVIGRGRKR